MRFGLFHAFLLASSACASTPRPERTFRFPSNYSTVEALRCVATQLRVEGFQVEQRPDTAVALRAPGSPSAAAPEHWWRLRVTMSRNDLGNTIVESLAGAGPSAEGPFQAPDLPLQEVVGRLTAACTWP